MHSTSKKIPRVTQYCKDKHGPKAYYDRNACRKNGKIIKKITLQKFQELSNDSHISNNDKKKVITRRRKSNNKTKKK